MIFQATDSRSSTSFPTYISRLRYNRAPHAFSLVRARTHSSPKIEIHKIYLSAYTNSQALLSNAVRYLLPATGINNACRLSNVLEQAEQELGEFFFPQRIQWFREWCLFELAVSLVPPLPLPRPAIQCYLQIQEPHFHWLVSNRPTRLHLGTSRDIKRVLRYPTVTHPARSTICTPLSVKCSNLV